MKSNSSLARASGSATPARAGVAASSTKRTARASLRIATAYTSPCFANNLFACYAWRRMAGDEARVVILGGGLTGISAAVHLRSPWVLFEREERLGGHARTDERDGFRFDKTGHWLHLRDPGVKRMVDELLPGQMTPIARRARIFSHGVLTRYPYQANLHGLPPEVIKECLDRK